ncbi:MAG: DUF4097 family beta strand repeat-containing protein [Pseudomonadota bacterium]
MNFAATIPACRAVGLALFALAIATSARADVIEKSFDIAAGGTLDLDTDVGAVKIDTHSANRIDVEVERDGPDANELIVEFETAGNRLKVNGRWEGGKQSWWNGKQARIVFRVTVPEQFNVDLNTRGGSIEIDDLSGEVDASTSGGSLRFGHIDGEIDANTSGGSIRIDGGSANIDVSTSGGSIKIGEATGDVRARTSGGSIRVRNAKGRIEARTSGGSVEAEMLVQPTGDSTLSTSGGSVRLYVADGIGLDVDATSSSGVRSEIPVGGETKAKRRLRGELNGGGPKVRLETSGGGVKIYRLAN